MATKSDYYEAQLVSQLAVDIENAPAPGDMTTKIVAIDGGGGAGKTSLARQLAASLGGATVVHVDDFISGANPPANWWHALRDQVFVPLQAGRPARYHRYEGGSLKLDEWLRVECGGVIIIEGFGSLRPEFRPYLTFGVWVDTSADMRLQRGLARNKEDLKQWRKWQQQDRAYYDGTRPDLAANTIIRTATHRKATV